MDRARDYSGSKGVDCKPQCLGVKKGSLKVVSEGVKGPISPRGESWSWDIS